MTKSRKAMLVVAIFVLVSTALTLPLLYSPKGSGVVATSIEVLGYATNKQGELWARVRLKNSGTATLIYEPGCFAGGAPPIGGHAETEHGWTAFDGPDGGTASLAWIFPGSNRVFSLPLPDTTSRWQITYEVSPAASPRIRTFLSLVESGRWNGLHPAAQWSLQFLPHIEAQPVRTHSEMFIVPEGLHTRSSTPHPVRDKD